jgi:hypothetical protein
MHLTDVMIDAFNMPFLRGRFHYAADGKKV